MTTLTSTAHDELQIILVNHAKWVDGDPPSERADLSHADLRHADLHDANLSGADLSHADLRGANLSHANLSGADLSGADLSHADLRHADLHDADLHDANLSGADLRGAVRDPFIIHPNFGHLIFSSAYFRWGYVDQKTGVPYIEAGCHRFTIAEARIYWANKSNRQETLPRSTISRQS